ncbi:MAG: hypothetical protein KJP00_15865 [Bacteroidia bacterium]|nr:hypothetical protein [Bacteroidia bacterium]
MRKLLPAISILITILIFSCVKEDEFSIIPEITYIGQTKISMNQGAFMEDSLFVQFSFTDGDGDIGDQDSINIFLTDTRQDFTTTYRIPEIPDVAVNDAIEGTVTLLLFTTCCLYTDNSQAPCTPSTSMPMDEVTYTLQIRDRAGNMSNSITLQPITLLCN